MRPREIRVDYFFGNAGDVVGDVFNFNGIVGCVPDHILGVVVTVPRLSDTADTDDVTGGDIDCIDFNGGGTALDATTTCTTNSLTLSEAGAPIIAPGGNFSIDWVADSLESSMSFLP